MQERITDGADRCSLSLGWMFSRWEARGPVRAVKPLRTRANEKAPNFHPVYRGGACEYAGPETSHVVCIIHFKKAYPSFKGPQIYLLILKKAEFWLQSHCASYSPQRERSDERRHGARASSTSTADVSVLSSRGREPGQLLQKEGKTQKQMISCIETVVW